MSHLWLRRLVPALVFGLALAGCGPHNAGPERHEIAGEVKIEGKPLAVGTVVFNPTAPKTQGGPVQARIEAGRYAAKVPAGKWKATFAAGAPVGTGSSGPPVGTATATIPPRYKEGVEVEITGPDPAKDFDLKAK